MVYTEFIPSDGLIRDAAKAIAKMKTSEEEAPIAIQIYGNNPEAMVEAAKMADRADSIAGGHGCDIIDINFGCPVSKIAGRGAGSGMMREPDKMVMITRMIVNARPMRRLRTRRRCGRTSGTPVFYLPDNVGHGLSPWPRPVTLSHVATCTKYKQYICNIKFIENY